MKLSNNGRRGAVSKRRLALFVTRKALPTFALGLGSALVFAGHALAQATSPTGGLGAQMNTMSSEAINSGGEAFGMGCYLAAAICFGVGVWALWQSRQPQNRENGLCRPRSRGTDPVRPVRHRGRVDQQGVGYRLRRQCDRQRHPGNGAVRHRRSRWLIARSGLLSTHLLVLVGRPLLFGERL